MKEALKNLKYFIGRAVTIITTPINREFDERQKCDYFVGIVEAVDEMGVLSQHPVTGCKNYYFFNQIIAISEEQVTTDPEVIAEIKEKRQGATALLPIEIPPVVQPQPPSSPFIDIDSLSKLSR